MQVHTKLLAQWRNLQEAKQGSFKHWLYRYSPCFLAGRFLLKRQTCLRDNVPSTCTGVEMVTFKVECLAWESALMTRMTDGNLK